jgi:hypothetical protein
VQIGSCDDFGRSQCVDPETDQAANAARQISWGIARCPVSSQNRIQSHPNEIIRAWRISSSAQRLATSTMQVRSTGVGAWGGLLNYPRRCVNLSGRIFGEGRLWLSDEFPTRCQEHNALA